MGINEWRSTLEMPLSKGGLHSLITEPCIQAYFHIYTQVLLLSSKRDPCQFLLVTGKQHTSLMFQDFSRILYLIFSHPRQILKKNLDPSSKLLASLKSLCEFITKLWPQHPRQNFMTSLTPSFPSNWTFKYRINLLIIP